MNNLLCVKIFFVFFVLFVGRAEPNLLRCDIPAPIAVLINADTGKVLFDKNGGRICYPASTTKVASVLYVLHKKGKEIDGVVTASQDAVGIVSAQARRHSGKYPSYRLEYGGTHAGIMPGEKLDIRTLLYGTMLVSGNDATNVLAETVSGSIPRFIDELNIFLRAIGCKHTYFTNPHGLTDHRHVTTALDMALIARLAYKNPIFKEVVSTISYQRPQTNKREPFVFYQSNALLKPGKKSYYPYATGIKTGYTNQAGWNLIASAKKGDRDLIAVVFNCDENAKRYRSAVQLFEAAFNEPKQTRKLLSAEYDAFHKELQGAKSNLRAVLQNDLTVCFYPSEEKEFYSDVEWNLVDLPVRQGQIVGSVRLFDMEGNVEASIPLVAAKDVEPTFAYKISGYIKQTQIALKQKRAYFGYGAALGLLGLSFWLVKRKRLKI